MENGKEKEKETEKERSGAESGIKPTTARGKFWGKDSTVCIERQLSGKLELEEFYTLHATSCPSNEHSPIVRRNSALALNQRVLWVLMKICKSPRGNHPGVRHWVRILWTLLPHRPVPFPSAGKSDAQLTSNNHDNDNDDDMEIRSLCVLP
ncbi:hypothetical protein M5D96_005559 [Drosophila gunungcola]|uniref:Uncharacterized protein n=1 Tax=Drosophila gunungcola TaxID=103775 RepID=A0A9P9YR89_9MUSC|nr:hypothetical protein M5D96_005559 [Drosophila gunungcola]